MRTPATLLAVLLALAFTGTALARPHTDRAAGIRFEVPFPNAKVVSGASIEESVRQRLGKGFPDDLHYTSGIYAEGNVPYVLVWTRKAEGPLTRNAVDAKVSAASAGLRDFRFDRQLLRGEGSLPDQGGLKVKVVLQLVKGRYAYVGYYYRTPAQLKGFDTVKRSLFVGRKSRLSYDLLPDEASLQRNWLVIVAGLAAALGVGGLAYAAYRRMAAGDGGVPADVASRVREGDTSPTI